MVCADLDLQFVSAALQDSYREGGGGWSLEAEGTGRRGGATPDVIKHMTGNRVSHRSLVMVQLPATAHISTGHWILL